MTYRESFPDFELGIVLPDDFVDISFKQDSCPSFQNKDLGLILFVDYMDCSKREHPLTNRFHVYNCDTDGCIGKLRCEGDYWDTVLAFIEGYRRLDNMGRRRG